MSDDKDDKTQKEVKMEVICRKSDDKIWINKLWYAKTYFKEEYAKEDDFIGDNIDLYNKEIKKYNTLYLPKCQSLEEVLEEYEDICKITGNVNDYYTKEVQ